MQKLVWLSPYYSALDCPNGTDPELLACALATTVSAAAPELRRQGAQAPMKITARWRPQNYLDIQLEVTFEFETEAAIQDPGPIDPKVFWGLYS